jgi:hypothetical protein
VKAITFNRAIDMLRSPERRLVKMSVNQSPAYFIAPGGPVSLEVAEKIKSHPLVHPMQDGLFPGHDQTWRIGT